MQQVLGLQSTLLSEPRTGRPSVVLSTSSMRVRPLLISNAQQLCRQRGRTATGIFTAAFPVSSPVRCYQTWPHVLSLTRSAVTRV